MRRVICFSYRKYRLYRVLILILFLSIPSVDPLLAGPQKSNILYLEVSINGIPKHIIAKFEQHTNGEMALAKEDFAPLRLNLPSMSSQESSYIPLNKIPGVSYRYDESTQTINVMVPETALSTKIITAGNLQSPPLTPSATGALFNYTLFGVTAPTPFLGPFLGPSSSMLSLAGEVRAFSPWGTASQSFLTTNAPLSDINSINKLSITRLDSVITYRDPHRLLMINGGDFISASLPWTRSVRLGGLQIQRNFSLQPTLVTMPLPEFTGSAAVPSTLDIYNQNMRVFSTSVDSGPFHISKIPTLSNTQGVNIVLRDALGRETTTTLPFYSSAKLLAPGLWDFSLEAGYPRYFYGAQASQYGDSAMSSASIRRGITSFLTVEAHAEMGGGLIQGGLGSIIRLGSAGIFSLAGAASSFKNSSVGITQRQAGYLIRAAYEILVGRIALSASTQRTSNRYFDLASASDLVFQNFSLTKQALALSLANPELSPLFPFSLSMPLIPLYAAPIGIPTAFDQIIVSLPLFNDPSAISIGFTNTAYALSTLQGTPYAPQITTDAFYKAAVAPYATSAPFITSRILNISYSRAFAWNSTVSLTAFSDFSNRNSKGVFVSYAMPLGDKIWASASGNAQPGANTGGFDLSKSIASGDKWAWRLSDREGQVPFRMAQVQYSPSNLDINANIQQTGQSLQLNGQVSGSVVVVGSHVHAGKILSGPFALVNAGAPNVVIEKSNLIIGRTNKSGYLLVPNLLPYQENKLSLDPATLPLNINTAETEKFVVPEDKTGIIVSFGRIEQSPTQLITFVDHTNRPLPAGSEGIPNGHMEDSFIVGYDGQAYVSGLRNQQNSVELTTPQGTCRAEFNYAPPELFSSSVVPYGPIVCLPNP